MPKARPPYPPEYRRRMVELVRSGRTPESLSREFEATAQSISNWVRQADLDEGRRCLGSQFGWTRLGWFCVSHHAAWASS